MLFQKIPQCYASAVLRIASRQNTVVKEYRDAARGVDRDTILLDGGHLLDEALAAGIRLRHVMIADDALEHPDVAHMLERLRRTAAVVTSGAPAVMAAVSPVQSSSTMVGLAARPQPGSVYRSAASLVVIACDVQNPGNLGAIVRVAEAAGASGVIAAGQCADPFGWKAIRGSMGSVLRVPVAAFDSVHDAMADARHHGLALVATVPRSGVPHALADFDRPVGLLIGGEGVGLAPDVVASADLRVTIPMCHPVESLNAAVASAILLYEATRQRTTDAVSS